MIKLQVMIRTIASDSDANNSFQPGAFSIMDLAFKCEGSIRRCNASVGPGHDAPVRVDAVVTRMP